MSYKPEGCYRITRSVKGSRKKGKPVKKKKEEKLEQLMFEDYGWLSWTHKFLQENSGPESKKNRLQVHLEELLQKGESIEPVALCPQCKKRKARYMSVLTSASGISAYIPFTCCESEDCINKARGMAPREPQFLPLRFSTLARFKNKSDQGMVADVLKWAHGIEEFTEKSLFNLFWEQPKSTV